MIYFVIFFFWCLVALLSAVLLALSFFANDVSAITAVIALVSVIPFSMSVLWFFYSKKSKSLRNRKTQFFYRDTPKLLTYLFVISFSAFFLAGAMKLNDIAFCLILLALSVMQVGFWYPFCWGKNTLIYRKDIST